MTTSSKSSFKIFTGSTTRNIITVTITALALSAFSMYAVVIIAFGILPGLIASVIDRDRERYLARIVLTYNCLGIAPFVVSILKNSSKSAAIDIVVDPSTWLIIFGSAGLGWVVYWLFPQIGIIISDITANVKVKQLENEIEQLVKEWGSDILEENQPKL